MQRFVRAPPPWWTSPRATLRRTTSIQSHAKEREGRGTTYAARSFTMIRRNVSADESKLQLVIQRIHDDSFVYLVVS